jgi:hypothetical protein
VISLPAIPVMALTALTFAQSEGGGGDWGGDQIIQLVNYGVLGIIVIGAVTGFVEFKPSITRLVRENDRQHTQIEGLVSTYEERVIPVLVAANEMLARLAEEERRRRDRREWEESLRAEKERGREERGREGPGREGPGPT